jgi:hypothetical protein
MGKTIKGNEIKASMLTLRDINTDVKLRVITASGKTGLTPNDILREDKLKTNLDYSSDDYDILQILLDKYVKNIKSTSSVSSTEINKCETVGDCIDLVKKKI